MFRVIHHTFGPLADARQCRLAFGLLFQPWKWKNGNECRGLRQKLQEHFSANVWLFGTGREALLALLRSLHLKPNDEVIVQGYTCIVVPNAVIAAGGTPVFVDIEKETLSLNVEAVEKAITPRTRVIICQHTFGLEAPLLELRDLCAKHNLLLIEDCAHIIPEKITVDGIGGVGGAVLLSFGRDKAISGVAGGAIVCRAPHLEEALDEKEKNSFHFSLLTIIRLLLYPLLYGICRPLYGMGIGKALLKLAGMTRILLPITKGPEKRGIQDPLLHAMPNACAVLALDQLEQLSAINTHRRELVRFYLEQSAQHGWPVLHGIHANAPLQKYPLFLEGAERIRQRLKTGNIYLHDGWTGCVVCPETSDCAAVGYKDGDDPCAEDVSEQILCLPTHPGMTMKDAKLLVYNLSAFFGENSRSQ